MMLRRKRGPAARVGVTRGIDDDPIMSGGYARAVKTTAPGGLEVDTHAPARAQRSSVRQLRGYARGTSGRSADLGVQGLDQEVHLRARVGVGGRCVAVGGDGVLASEAIGVLQRGRLT